VSLSGMYAYENHDGKPGFQYILGDVLVCPADSSKLTTDCMVPQSYIEFKTISWSPVSKTQQNCPSTAGYVNDNNTCQIYEIKSKGTWTDTVSPFTSYEVCEVTLYLASQKVIINGRPVSPDNGETVWNFKYPWAAKNIANPLITGVGAAVGVAGQAGSVEETKIYDSDGLSFSGSSKSGYMTWAPTADVDGTDKDVHVLSFSGDTILGYTYPVGSDPYAGVVIFIWQVSMKIWKDLGWSTQLIFFSWDQSMPTTIIYDPAFGQTDSGALGLAPSLWFTLVICVAHYFYRKF